MSQSNTRHAQLLDAMEQRGDYSVRFLAAELDWPRGRVLYFLQSLREAGRVAYLPGYRKWTRTDR